MRDAGFRSGDDRSAECAAFPFERIPRRVFLDTNVVNCLVKWSDCVFEHQATPPGLKRELSADIDSLRGIFVVGSRAQWDIVVSEKTIDELSQTPNEHLRDHLLDYGSELVGYCRNSSDDDGRYARDLARRMIDSVFLAALPDRGDRELVAHAVALECDTFCTCDRRTIYKKRDLLRHVPVRIMTPSDWWQHIRPWGRLWL